MQWIERSLAVREYLGLIPASIKSGFFSRVVGWNETDKFVLLNIVKNPILSCHLNNSEIRPRS